MPRLSSPISCCPCSRWAWGCTTKKATARSSIGRCAAIGDLERIGPIDAAGALGFVADAIKLARKGLDGKVPLIGFAGAPFTLASYLIEGGGSRQYLTTKRLMYNHPEVWAGLMKLLARVTSDYLAMQIEAGADIIQLFDSWVGSLGPDDYQKFVLPYTAEIIGRLPAAVPVIHFGTITGNLLELMRAAGGDVIGLDWRVNLAEAWARLGHSVAVQGNLDPIALFAGVDEIRVARQGDSRSGGRPPRTYLQPRPRNPARNSRRSRHCPGRYGP